jgi:hypothetical protein
MLGQVKPFASLSGGLLARKGAARPAMRPQGLGSLQPTPQQLDDLGWNDMGAEPAPAPAAEPEKPPVLVEREALAQVVETPATPIQSAPLEPIPLEPVPIGRSVSVATASRLSRETAHVGRAAFTLRLDAERHLKLRLASALSHRSAQQLVGQALDQFLHTMPEVEALVAQLPPQTLGRSKGKRK